jgi:septal ring factor EnvC (AmiA/AmiB activator)
LVGEPAIGQTESQQRDLERIRRGIETLEKKLREVSRERDDSQARLAQLSLKVRLQEERVAEARAERGLASTRLDAAESAVSVAAKRLERSQKQLQRGLSTLYRLGRGGLWRWLVTAPDAERTLSGVRLLRFLSWRGAQRVAAYRSDRQAYEHQRALFEAASRENEESLNRERSRLIELERVKRRQSMIVAALERERASLAKRGRELGKRQAKLTELISFLAGQSPPLERGTPIQRFKGVLDWPAEGRVVIPFGPRRDAQYGTRVPHDGITMQMAARSAARAVFPGSVVFAAEFQGFGNTVVVHHPSRVFTLYSGLESIEVRKNDVVSSGQRLGDAGLRMYFEVRVEERPQNPVEWLR